LSFLTPSHLKEIGLLPDTVDDSYKQLINTQLGVALSKIPILPWTYLVDLWRWNVFSGKTPKENYQKDWIKLVERYQGMSRPMDSTPEDFDPGAKYHVASNVPYIRYFGAAIIQFQFHEALCEAANHTGPIHKCSIFNSTAAGERFAEMLSLGKSMAWQEAIRVVTQGKASSLDGKAILDYFEPLNKWLEEQNRGKQCGWGDRARVF
jgi:peptidyl-dipeptidase A